jgi:flavin reductase (DIM6/NTAB) family NADH-FMN oxidoreductase RutF
VSRLPGAAERAAFATMIGQRQRWPTEDIVDLAPPPPESVYFYYPRPVCVVGVRDDSKGTVNFAPVTWTSPLSSDPPFFGICLSPSTHTHRLVLSTGEFTINFVDYELHATVERIGRLSGRAVDKVKELSLALAPPQILSTPSLADAYFSAECSVFERHHLGDQTLVVGEVMRTRVSAAAFDARGVLRLEAVRPLLYLGNNRYASTDALTATADAEECTSERP